MKLKQTVLILALFVGAFGVAPVSPALAADCGGVPTSVISCDQPGGKSKNVEDSGLWGLLILIINIMSAGVIIAGIGGVAYGSVLYTTSGGNLDQVKRSRVIIANTIVGLVVFVLLSAFLNYLIPGGIFK